MQPRCASRGVYLSKKVAPHLSFILDRISPKSVIGADRVLTDQKADQVMDLLVRYSLDIEKQFDVLPSERRDMLQVDLPRSYG